MALGMGCSFLVLWGYAVLGGKGSWGSRFAGLEKGGFAGEDIAVGEG